MSLLIDLVALGLLPVLSLITLVAIDRATPRRRESATVILPQSPPLVPGKRFHVE